MAISALINRTELHTPGNGLLLVLNPHMNNQLVIDYCKDGKFVGNLIWQFSECTAILNPANVIATIGIDH